MNLPIVNLFETSKSRWHVRKEPKQHSAQGLIQVMVMRLTCVKLSQPVLFNTGTSLPTAAAAPVDKPFVYTEPTMELQGPLVPNTHQLEEVCSPLLPVTIIRPGGIHGTCEGSQQAGGSRRVHVQLGLHESGAGGHGWALFRAKDPVVLFGT